jgi:hypothetical protein
MNDERGMIVHFVDGTKLKLSFPKQVKTDEAVSIRLEKLLDKPALMVQADGALLSIPFSSIKYLQVYPVPGGLPDYVIKGASIVE